MNVVRHLVWNVQHLQCQLPHMLHMSPVRLSHDRSYPIFVQGEIKCTMPCISADLNSTCLLLLTQKCKILLQYMFQWKQASICICIIKSSYL